ncbi:MAG: hypothetical protein AB1394_05520 [Bacteroidota bacterium]
MEPLLTIFGIFIGAFITLFAQWYDQKTKFRLVAIEKRLQTHQEAFSWWYKLIWVIHSPSNDRIPVITEARKFWLNNCLYLERKTRKEFDIIIKLVDGYSDKLQHAKITLDSKEKEIIRQEYLGDWNRIFQLPELIQSEVELEPIVPDLKISAEG